MRKMALNFIQMIVITRTLGINNYLCAMDYTIDANPCESINIPSCFTGEIRISTIEPDGTDFQVHLLIDGKMEVIDTVSVGGYIPFTPTITIYSIPFWVTIGTNKMRIVPHPTNTPPDNIIINL